MNLLNDFNNLKSIYPIKEFNAETNYVEISEDKDRILNNIYQNIRYELHKKIEAYWGHSNFDVLVRTDFRLVPMRVSDKKFEQIYQLSITCAYYDGGKEKIIFDVSYKLNDNGIKVETEDIPKKNKDFIEIHRIIYSYLEDLKINA